MHLLTLFGIFLIAVGTICTIAGQNITINKSNDALRDKSNEIAELSQENIKLSSELSKISQEIAATVTGGESFCYLFPEISSEKMNTINFRLSHMGEYPVYDVLIRIWDATCLSQISSSQIDTNVLKMKNRILTYEEWNTLKKDPQFISQSMELNRIITEKMNNCLLLQKNIGTIVPNKTTNIMDPIYLSCTIPSGVDVNKYTQEYSISTIARNGQYNQEIKIDIRNSKIHIYSKVENSKAGTVREFESMDTDIFIIQNLK